MRVKPVISKPNRLIVLKAESRCEAEKERARITLKRSGGVKKARHEKESFVASR